MVDKMAVGIMSDTLTEAEMIAGRILDYDVFAVKNIYACLHDSTPKLFEKHLICQTLDDFKDGNYDIVISTVEDIGYKISDTIYLFSNNTEALFNKLDSLINVLKHSKEVIKSISNKIEVFSTSKYTFNDIIGESMKVKKCICLAKKAAHTDIPVLVTGETGTGKELIAHSIHAESKRRAMPFVVVNCAAVPDHLLESEFFGHEKGAFTGAVSKKIGKFELADKGTIFLDEIGELNLGLQTKLLRVLQDKVIEPIGSLKPKRTDVRIISATNQNLKKMIEEGRFREDLYYRLHTLEVHMPPLRERKEDIPLLIDSIIKKISRIQGKVLKGFTKGALSILMNYEWPGNIRELENFIEKIVITYEGYTVDENYILQNIYDYKANRENDPMIDQVYSLDVMEKKLILKALEKYGNGVVGKQLAAQKLNISLSTLYNKIQKYNLKGDLKRQGCRDSPCI
jgi:transcriptional regulator with PAS, ATPase and Fis domain